MFRHITLSTIKYLACSILAATLLLSCEESNIGVKVRPTEDNLTVATDTFCLGTKTVKSGSLYSESDKLVLGSYSDNIFGSFKVDFLSEFRYVRDLKFPNGTKGDSLFVVMYYKTFFGDESAVQEATVYQLDKQPLKFSENYNCDIDVSKFCSKNIILGRQRYVAYDETVSDSTRSLPDYCNKVKVSMPKAMLDEMISRTDIYKSQDAFVEYLKGVYVTNTFGQQTVLRIDSVNLEMKYHYNDTLVSKVSGNKDSVVVRNKMALFPANKETTEVIHVAESTPVDIESIPDSLEYISAPGGTFVEVNIPYMTIYKRVVEANETKNDGMLNFNYYSLLVEPAQMAETSLRTLFPTYFIFIRKADVDKFFVQSLYPVDGINTILGVYDFYSNAGRYTFSNSGSYLEDVMKHARGLGSDAERENYFAGLNPYLIIPVTGTNDIAGTNATVRHLYDAYGIRVRSGRNEKSPMRMVITYTNL